MTRRIELPVRVLPGDRLVSEETALDYEWLFTNGLGGFASGTVANIPTRRYHGLLVAALPAPHGRMVMLSHVTELLRIGARTPILLGGIEFPDRLSIPGRERLLEFRLEGGIPTWRYEVDGHLIEKRVILPHEQNSVHVSYQLLEGEGPVRIKLRPELRIASLEDPLSEEATPCTVLAEGERYELAPPAERHLPCIRLFLHGESRAFTIEPRVTASAQYRLEQRRGYHPTASLWSPGYFRATLTSGNGVTLIASTEPWETLLVLSPEAALASVRERAERLLESAGGHASDSFSRELVLAADQFVVKPVGRSQEHARARAVGDEVRTIIAGYHWFTDWGRDTMISLEGLTLVTGRHIEAGFILRTFAQYVRDGLIPNLFPEGEREGLYHTADATLWYFHAIHRYLAHTDDRRTLDLLLPNLVSIYEAHVRGTHFGIGVDPADGLIRQGAEGYQLTWMDAKVEDWVVTPRRGKPVEINALWYNALRHLAEWLRLDGQLEFAARIDAQADLARESFNVRFWSEKHGHLFDVVDGPQGDDPACRPNQILSISLTHPVLDPARWEAVFRVVEERLLTPVGLRSLSPDHPDYKKRYFGDLRSRDAAYHQGTVWAWLIGPFVDALRKLHPERRDEARRFLAGFEDHLSHACIGSISEIFDAEAPFTPRGCVAQAWSIAEVLRAYAETSPAPASPQGAGESLIH